MPKAAVNITSKNAFAKLLNGPTHPAFSPATLASAQVPSLTNGGLLASAYPQQSNCHRPHGQHIQAPSRNGALSWIGWPYLLLQQALHDGRLRRPHGAQVRARLERVEPDEEAEREGEDAAAEDEPAVGAQPGAVGGEEQGRQRGQEGREGQERVEEGG